MRGEQYGGNVCEWVAGDLFFDELSWVNVPADSDAMITTNGLTSNTMSTGEGVTDLGGGKIVASSIKANHIDTSTSTLTPDSGVVKSVSESNEKEENIVTQEDKML